MERVLKMGASYDIDYYEKRQASWAVKIEAVNIVKLLNLQDSDKIAEIGCGGGVLLGEITKDVFAVGIDINENVLKFMKKTNPALLGVAAEAGKLPLKDKSLGKIISQHLVEHIEDLPAVLNEWRRVLREDGILIIATPNDDYAQKDKKVFYDSTHTHIYNINRLREQLRAARFRIKKVYTVIPYLFKPEYQAFSHKYHWIFRYLPYFNKRGRTIILKAVKCRCS
jgi:ubiquinone/menaquinone biosynthesis C-methylase UbiE